jgi:hypothetical protein
VGGGAYFIEEQSVKLSNSVVAAVSRELEVHYSNSELQDLLAEARLVAAHRLSSDAPDTRRGQVLLKDINDWALDPVAVLGKILAPYMDPEVPNPHTEVGMLWLNGRDRIIGELEACGLDYVSGGALLKNNRPKRIEVSQLYFMVWYEDSLRLNLYPEPLIFVGRNLDSDDRRSHDVWCFQNLDSYSEFGVYNSLSKLPERSPAGFLTCLQYDDLFQVVDYTGLAKRLLNSAERRSQYESLSPFSRDLLYYRIHYHDSAQLLLSIQSLKFVDFMQQPASTEAVFRFREIRSLHESSYEYEAEGGASFDLKDGQLVEVHRRDAASVIDCRGLAAELERCAARQTGTQTT